MTNQMFAWGPAALWAVVLFSLSSIPGSAIEGISVSDLFIHTCVYSVLGAALVYGRWKGVGRMAPRTTDRGWGLVRCQR